MPLGWRPLRFYSKKLRQAVRLLAADGSYGFVDHLCVIYLEWVFVTFAVLQVDHERDEVVAVGAVISTAAGIGN